MVTKNLHLMYAYPVKAGEHEVTTVGIEIDMPKELKSDDIIGVFPIKGIVFEKTTEGKVKARTLADTVSLTDSDILYYIVSRNIYEN